MTDCPWNQDTLNQIRAPIKHGRPKCDPAQRLPESNLYAPLFLELIGIFLSTHQQDAYGTRLFFFNWVRAPGRCQDTPGIPKNATGPSTSSQKGMPPAPCDEHSPSKKCKSVGDSPPPRGEPWPTATGTRIHPTRSAHR